MTVDLFEMDGVTRLVQLDVPLDDVPKVAVWQERTFLLRSTVHQARRSTVSYVETFPIRLELPAGVGQ